MCPHADRQVLFGTTVPIGLPQGVPIGRCSLVLCRLAGPETCQLAALCRFSGKIVVERNPLIQIVHGIYRWKGLAETFESPLDCSRVRELTLGQMWPGSAHRSFGREIVGRKWVVRPRGKSESRTGRTVGKAERCTLTFKRVLLSSES